MKRITLNVDVAEARDLLERVPRACLSFVDDQGPHVEPTILVVKDDCYLVGMSAAAKHPTSHQEVVLLVDDGCQFFDLRAVYVRGVVQPQDGVEGPAEGVMWFVVQPTRAVAWDYARIRASDDQS
ncbi:MULTISPECIES: hypothetical protein [unclassified Mycolicibacterium]|uniref:hypothetical protein n=1 Tax=unclassified Mycolicibacterium TaxID=2636767 RepID=UPI0012DDB6E3|nr:MULTISPECIES: hypothetical protein [unclassified Mycolicibacterium]MUL81326.1 hypothetical protein [Mycolicibacterium sp. CBMA 329]MUL87092.1 hypothetical protein [Mycolicibacterium sp. CBMA 331]MUL98626.1 hypothetical protein [Mycolicibacterium sp. CBMA 334]MUM29502.1 hypothetical protein [Mycolicibacterium sp. CBMA 295]MUM37389.1 hypothetical protein [Mycolicibacterium sp. CBMA 247]